MIFFISSFKPPYGSVLPQHFVPAPVSSGSDTLEHFHRSHHFFLSIASLRRNTGCIHIIYVFRRDREKAGYFFFTEVSLSADKGTFPLSGSFYYYPALPVWIGIIPANVSFLINGYEINKCLIVDHDPVLYKLCFVKSRKAVTVL